MMFSDRDGTSVDVNDDVLHVHGRFDRVDVDCWFVRRELITDANLVGLDAQLNDRLDLDQWTDAPMVLSSPASCAVVGEQELSPVITDDRDQDGWQVLSRLKDDKERAFVAEELRKASFKVCGGNPKSKWAFVFGHTLPLIAPPVRVLHHLPATHVGGLNPFLTAIGAEPVAVMDSLSPLLQKLEEKGPGNVAVMSRAGAFLWTLDLDGRSGVDAAESHRVDEDVVIPITAGLPQDSHVSIESDITTLLPRAREGELDLAFLVNPPDANAMKERAEDPKPLAHALHFQAPFGVDSMQ